MQVVVRFWEPRSGGQLEQRYENARALSFLNETVTIVCAKGTRHCYPVHALVEVETEGGSYDDGKLAGA